MDNKLNMVIILGDGRKKTIEVNEKLKDSISFCLIEIDSLRCGILENRKTNAILPQSNYDKVRTESQRLLKEQDIANDVFELLSAMAIPNHTSICFEY